MDLHYNAYFSLQSVQMNSLQFCFHVHKTTNTKMFFIAGCGISASSPPHIISLPGSKPHQHPKHSDQSSSVSETRWGSEVLHLLELTVNFELVRKKQLMNISMHKGQGMWHFPNSSPSTSRITQCLFKSHMRFV